MTATDVQRLPNEFDLVGRGFTHQLAERFGLAGSHPARRASKVLLIFAVTWIPLALLSLGSGHAVGGSVHVPFFHDPEVHVRLLFVLPLLELAEVVVALSLKVQANHLLTMGVVAERDRPRFVAAQAEAMRIRDSAYAECAILVVSYVMAFVLRLFLGLSEGESSWERVGDRVTAAGWWHMLVSLPILYFFLLRWLLVFAVWSKFLFDVSRLELELTPTHPDRTGGLGFLGWGLASFSTVLMATSAVFSAGLAAEIFHHGESLDTLKYHVMAFVVAALIVLHAPLLAFSAQLTRCRFKGLLEFGELVWRHDREFDEKWIKSFPDPSQERLLGTSDVQSMSDIATCYEHINEMWLIPFDMKASAVLALSALLPMAPLLGTAIPLDEIFMKLGEILI